MDSSIIVGDFIMPSSMTERKSWQKICKIEELKDTVTQLEVTDINRTLHPTRA